MEATTPLSTNVETRQKRVLPLRARRGGPVIGSCDADVMILDMQKRKENDLLIPIETQFFLTTNSSLIPPSPSSMEPGSSRSERYLDQPERFKAHAEQESAQTPEFSLLSEDASVGGRFRPREPEDQAADTSDAVYEKRHRKYELIEKRQRLREKEKLKHEHYKLKERIEQLRSVDGSAFLSLPSSSFSFTPVRSNEEDDEESVAKLLRTHGDGVAGYSEGERRRKEMLDLALALEERYRTLLPPERKEKNSFRASAELNGDIIGDDGSEHHYGGESQSNPEEKIATEKDKIRLKIKFPSRVVSSAIASHTRTAGRRKSRLSLPSPLLRHDLDPPSTPQARSSSPAGPPPKRILLSRGVISDADDSPPHPRPRKRRRTLAMSPEDNTMYQYDASCESISAPSQPSTSRVSAPGMHTSYVGASGNVERATCLLMIAARRTSGASKARKTQRHVTAFGVKIPPEVEEMRDFAIPSWLIEKDENTPDHVTEMLEKLDVHQEDVSMSDVVPTS